MAGHDVETCGLKIFPVLVHGRGPKAATPVLDHAARGHAPLHSRHATQDMSILVLDLDVLGRHELEEQEDADGERTRCFQEAETGS